MRRWLAWSILTAVFVIARPTEAAIPTCDTLPNPVYLQVGDTQTNFMLLLGRQLRDNAPNPITLVFVTNGSCTNVAEMYGTAVSQITATMTYAPSIAEVPSWNYATDPPLTCTPPAGGVLPDIGNSALFISSCANITISPPSTLAVVAGPIQGYVLAVPKASSQTSITYEQAYFVFGFGMAGMIDPWIDEAEMFIRTVTKSTLLTWAANISVPATKWKGVPLASSPLVVSGLQGAANPEAAIGILGDEVYDALRSTLTVLAYRAKHQYAAYYPDSTFTSRDKKNIRDGHYTVWSPTFWMYNLNGDGSPVKPAAKYIVDLIAGNDATPAPNFDMPSVVATVGLVPDCAMGVQRAFDGGPLSFYTPPESCVCKYESVVAQTTCNTCSEINPCASGVCRNGYCEVQ